MSALDITKVAASTIERWFYTYQTGGFDALLPKRRIDTGKPRKLDTDITEQIRFLKKEYPRIPATLIHQKLIDNGTIKPGDVSLSTITRCVNETAYEVPYIYAKQKIILRYDTDFENVYVVNRETGELTPIKLLNKHDNAHIKREKVRLTGGEF